MNNTGVGLRLHGRRPAFAVLAAFLSTAIYGLAQPAAPSSPAVGFEQYSLPNGSVANGITSGPGGLWFTDLVNGKVGWMTTAGGVTAYAAAPPYGGMHFNGDEAFIAAGPGGALWFTEGDQIGQLTSSGSVTLHPLPGAYDQPLGITAGPDGALWFTETGGNNIGRITTSGALSEYPLPALGSAPQNIAAGPDGALWFTEWGANRIGRITTSGVITEYAVPTKGAAPFGIAAGPDGALWFAEFYGYKIGRITTGGAITEYAIPSAGRPQLLTNGPDGALWFTEYEGRLGRITPGGAVTEFAVPGQGDASLFDITLGPDNALWFTEGTHSHSSAGGAIGRASLGPAPVISSISNSAVSGSAGAIAPGELITIKGANLGPPSGASFTLNALGGVNSLLGGVQVLFGNTPGTPTYVSAGQINVIAPWEIAGTGTAQIVISFGGAESAGVSLPIAGVAPAIYTSDSTGAGQAVAVNLTGTAAGLLNSAATAAAPGSFIAVYLTGGGQTNPASETGSINPQGQQPFQNWTAGSGSVTATIGSQPATVQYAGAAPGFVAGVDQVNLQVPAGVSSGSLPVIITIDGVQTQTTATVAVAGP